MRFNVHALDAAQQVVALSLEAPNAAAARERAAERGLSVFSVEGGKRALALPRFAPESTCWRSLSGSFSASVCIASTRFNPDARREGARE